MRDAGCRKRQVHGYCEVSEKNTYEIVCSLKPPAKPVQQSVLGIVSDEMCHHEPKDSLYRKVEMAASTAGAACR